MSEKMSPTWNSWLLTMMSQDPVGSSVLELVLSSVTTYTPHVFTRIPTHPLNAMSPAYVQTHTYITRCHLHTHIYIPTGAVL